MKPLLKWVGGKTQILEDVLAEFPTTIQNYHEPFVGGGSVLLGVLSSSIRILGTVYASDVNPHLVELYMHVQQDPGTLIVELTRLGTEYNQCRGTVVNRSPTTEEEARTSRESFYYWCRSQFNQRRPERSIVKSALFLFLNKTCFRGVYREGPRGFNVPYGHYVQPFQVDEEHIRSVSNCIRNVVFTVQSFEQSLSRCGEGDFVYADPPYVPETMTSFVGYTSDGFSKHEDLFTRLKQLPCSMTMSNSNVELVRQSFPVDRYIQKSLTARRSINSRRPESTTTEVLITTRPTS